MQQCHPMQCNAMNRVAFSFSPAPINQHARSALSLFLSHFSWWCIIVAWNICCMRIFPLLSTIIQLNVMCYGCRTWIFFFILFWILSHWFGLLHCHVHQFRMEIKKTAIHKQWHGNSNQPSTTRTFSTHYSIILIKYCAISGTFCFHRAMHFSLSLFVRSVGLPFLLFFWHFCHSSSQPCSLSLKFIYSIQAHKLKTHWCCNVDIPLNWFCDDTNVVILTHNFWKTKLIWQLLLAAFAIKNDACIMRWIHIYVHLANDYFAC